MIKKYLIICVTFFLFSNISLAEKVTVFNFTEEEFKSLKVRKVKGETTWTLGSNESGNLIKGEAEGKGYGLGKEIEIDFFATPFDFTSVEFLEKLNMPAYKIASADLTNTPLQKEIAKTNKQIFLSTGGGSLEDVKRAKENIFSINTNLAILHCTASYPAKVEEMNLSVLNTYDKEFPNITLGLSDHENGIDAGPIAYMLGARVFEKHFTLDRAKKGTDHSFSLEPQGLTKFVRNIHRIKKMLGSSQKQLLESEKKPLFKMKKSIVAKNDLIKDQLIKLSDLNFKSPGGGLEPYEVEKLLGKKLNKDISEDDYILFEDLV